MHKTYRIIINGRVQGVGFRPYVSKLARKMGLTGMVSNNEEGVIIFASGASDDVLEFYQELVNNPPPVARIKGHKMMKTKSIAFDTFEIVPTPQKVN